MDNIFHITHTPIMIKTLNLTGRPQDPAIYVDYLYPDELSEAFKRMLRRDYHPPVNGVMDYAFLTIARSWHLMAMRSIVESTWGRGDPYTEHELEDVFKPRVAISPSMRYGWYFHTTFVQAGFEVVYVPGTYRSPE